MSRGQNRKGKSQPPTRNTPHPLDPPIPSNGSSNIFMNVDNRSAFYSAQELEDIRNFDPEFYNDLKAEFLKNSEHIRAMNDRGMGMAEKETAFGMVWGVLALLCAAGIIGGGFYLAYLCILAEAFGSATAIVGAIAGIITAVVLIRKRKASTSEK